MNDSFDPVDFDIPEDELSSLDDVKKVTVMVLMARIAEDAFRRAIEETIENNYYISNTYYEKNDVSLDLAPHGHDDGMSTSIYKLIIFHGKSLERIGLDPSRLLKEYVEINDNSPLLINPPKSRGI